MSNICSTPYLDALDFTSKEVFNKKMDANKAYNQFLYKSPETKDTFEEAVEDAEADIAQEREKIKSINTKTQGGKLRVSEAKIRIKELQIIRDQNKTKANFWSPKADVLQNIQQLVMDQWARYADSKLYDDGINPWVLFPVIRHFTQDRINRQYDNLGSLHIKDLKAIYMSLFDAFNIANKRADKAAKLSGIDDTFTNPASAMFQNDPTGIGYSIIMDSQSLAEEVYSPVNKWSSQINTYYGNIDSYLDKQVDLEGVALERAQREMYDAIVDIMDEQLVYQTSAPVIEYNPGVKNKDGSKGSWQWTASKEDIKRIKEIVKRNIDLGIQAYGDIKTIEMKDANNNVLNRNLYVLIEQPTAENGREVWKAYEIPHIKKPDGNLELIDPRQETDWVDFFKNSNRKLANTNMEGGVLSQGLMPEGWYRTTEHQVKTANYHSKDPSYKVEAYNAYVKEDFMHDNEALWQAIKGIKAILIESYNMQIESHAHSKKKYDKLVDKIIKKSNSTISKDKITQKQIKQMLSSITNASSMNVNFSMEGGEIRHGSLDFNQRRHHVFRMYHEDVYFGALKRAIKEITIDVKKATEALSKPGATLEDRHALEDRKEILEMYKNSVNVFLGQTVDTDLALDNGKLNTATGSKFSKHRSMMMRPLRRTTTIDGKKTVVDRGMRKDKNIWIDGLETSMRAEKQGALQLKLTDAMLSTDAVIMDFLIDHVKGSFGHGDIKAGILGWDYSDKKMVDRTQRFLRKIPGLSATELTEAKFNMYSQWVSSMQSASMLSGGSAFTNNFQRTQFIVNNGLPVVLEAYRYLNDPLTAMIAENAAAEGGVTDVLVALADTLSSLTSDDNGILAGPMALKDLVLIRLDMDTFISRSFGTKWDAWFGPAVEKAYQKLGPDMDRVSAMKDIKKDVWNALNGLTSEDVTPAEQKALLNKLKRWFTTAQINKFATWALSGGVFNWSKSVKEIASMTGSEKTMRIEAYVIGGLKLLRKYGGHLEIPSDVAPGGEMEWLFAQPEAIDAGRAEVRQTMFGITNAFLPKIAKGGTGRQIMKFKLFPYMQGTQELKLLNNYNNIQRYDRYLAGASPEKINAIMATLTEGMLLVGRDIRHPLNLTEVYNINSSTLSATEKGLRLYLYIKCTATVFLDMFTKNFLATEILNFSRSFFGYQFTKGAQHGVSAILPSTALAFFQLIGGLYTLATSEEEEEAMKLLDAASFVLLPTFWNIAMRAHAKNTDQTFLSATGETISTMFLQPIQPITNLIGRAAEGIENLFDD